MIRYAISERNVLSMINHEFIVKLVGAFQDSTCLYLILEYCKYGNFSEFLDTMELLPESIAKVYAAEILLALEYLH